MRLGTRGSALALAQANAVAGALGGPEIVTITTSGDRDRARGDKERWVREIDAALREHGAEIVDQVLAENSGRWESASARDLARIEAVARAVMQRLLHEPTLRLKSADDIGGHGRQQLLRELFGLEEGAPAGDAPAPNAPAADVRPLKRRA